MKLPRLWVSSVLLSFFFFVPTIAHAAACCTSATAFGTGRLLLWESWAFGVRSQAIHEFGFYDDRGIYEPNDSLAIDQRFRLDAYSLFALSENASVFFVVPWLFPRLGYKDDVNMGSNISDVQIGYRHQMISIGEYEELPSLALTTSVLLPTGTPRYPTTPRQDVTGRDALVFMCGASLEKTWMPLFVQSNLGASLLINNIRSGIKTQNPVVPSFQIALAAGMEFATNWVASLLGQWVYEVPSKYRTEAGASLSWRFDPHCTAQINVNTDLFTNGFGSNWPGQFSYGFGIRYGYF